MTDKKKLDEQAILNVQNSANGITGETTFVADDMVELARLLKTAGVDSAMYNGAASLSVETNQGTGSVTSRVNAPDLRSIMNLLQPEFQQIGNEPAEVAPDAMDPRAQAHSDLDKAFNDGQEAGVEIYDPGMAPGAPVEEPCVDGACDAAAPEVDMGMDLDAPVEEQVVSENTEDDVFDILDYVCGLAAAGQTEGSEEFDYGYEDVAELFWQVVPYELDNFNVDRGVMDSLIAKAGQREIHDSGIYPDDDRQVCVLYVAAEVTEGEVDEASMVPYPGMADKQIVQPKTKAVPARSGDNPIDEGNNPFGEKTLDTYLRDGEVMVMYDHDSGDFDTGLDYPSTSSTGLTVTINSVMDQFDNELVDSLTPEERNRLEQECIDDLNSMEESAPAAPKGFRDYFQEAANRNAPTPVVAKAPVTTESLLGEFNKRRMPPQPRDYNTVARQARDFSKGGFVQHVDRHADGSHSVSDWMSNDTVGSFSNGQHYGGQDIEEGEIDEAGRSNYQDKARQFGEPYYLNTDCGFASLNDLGSHDYFGHDGVVILAINRGGKWGLNFVAGHASTKPGTKVTCVTQTSTGQKYREGKVVDSFTMDEYNNDRAGLEKRLAAHGITATKKLSVKTFD